MTDALITQAAGQGIWAILFLFMLFYVLKENGKREEKYQDIINKLTEKFEYLELGVDAIKRSMENINVKLDDICDSTPTCMTKRSERK